MIQPRPRRWWFTLLLGLLAIGDAPTSGQNPARSSLPSSIYDPRLASLRTASATWELRSGPDRAVIDQVCLVPDLPTFFEAIATWDQGQYFPILFDDVESSFRFIRAFKPARIIRFPRVAQPIAAEKTWEKAVETVGASWTSESNPAADKPKGDEVPKGLGPTPPGVVFSTPGALMLPGAVALAAGRFQPLLRLDHEKGFDEILTQAGVDLFQRDLAVRVNERIPNFGALGDECDFVTIAGDYPFRYKDPKGELRAVDDRLGRSIGSEQRWAFVGRLLGDDKDSVYRSMCSLFLQPESALMFNGYDEAKTPWSDYSMRAASQRALERRPRPHKSRASGRRTWGDGTRASTPSTASAWS